jgi:glutathione synthase
LAGTKKLQQVLATPGILEKFLTDPARVDAVKEIFTGLYSLDLVSITHFLFYVVAS